MVIHHHLHHVQHSPPLPPISNLASVLEHYCVAQEDQKAAAVADHRAMFDYLVTLAGSSTNSTRLPVSIIRQELESSGIHVSTDARLQTLVSYLEAHEDEGLNFQAFQVELASISGFDLLRQSCRGQLVLAEFSKDVQVIEEVYEHCRVEYRTEGSALISSFSSSRVSKTNDDEDEDDAASSHAREEETENLEEADDDFAVSCCTIDGQRCDLGVRCRSELRHLMHT